MIRILSVAAILAIAPVEQGATQVRPAALPTVAQSLQTRVEAVLARVGPGVRFGLFVADERGAEMIAIAPDQRFIPASNTKILTTAAAFATLPGSDAPDVAGGASVRLDGGRVPHVVLTGHGDARMSSAPDCVADCLATLADAVAARTRVVRDVVGDETLFPDERWSPGMSWNNLSGRSGTAASALSLDDNEFVLRVLPGAVGAAPRVEASSYYTVENRARTSSASNAALNFDRLPGSRVVRLSGTIGAGAGAQLIRLAIDNPAHYAAWRLRTLLEARGVRVTGAVATRHRPLSSVDDPALRGAAPPMRPPQTPALARLVPPPLAADLLLTNKVSQNLHAELLFRRVGRIAGTGSIADGRAAVAAMLARAGVPRTAWDISDGAGMSTYNRLSPRGMTTFLRWTQVQPWGAAWRATLPVGGVDGTLGRRFVGTPLQGRVFAKTGSLNATSALSGFMTARSGRTLAFSMFANDVPDGASATASMDAALALIAVES